MKTLVLADSSSCIVAGRERGSPFLLFGIHRAHYEFATCGMVMVRGAAWGERSRDYGGLEARIWVPDLSAHETVHLGDRPKNLVGP